MMNALSKRQQYGTWVTVVAHVALLLTLVLTRSARINGSQTPFVTAEFIALFAAAVVLIAAAGWLVFSGRLGRGLAVARTRQVGIVTGWVLLSYAALFIAPSFAAFLRPYLLPFALWLTLLDIGVGLVAFGDGSKPADAPQTASSAPPSPLRKAFWQVVTVVLSLLVPLLVIEIGLRAWFAFFGTPYERAAYTYSAAEIAQTESVFVGLPYVNYGLSPEYPSHNSLGYRGPEITQPKPAGVFRIVAMGGSTTYGISLNWSDAYPAQLQKILREDYGYSKVEVINAGVNAYTSWDSLVNFEFRVLDLTPDMIIVYDNINDIVARLIDPKKYNSLNALRGIWQTDPTPLSPSVLYRYIAINLGWMQNPATLDWQLRSQSDVKRCVAPTFCPNLNMTPEQVLAANPPIYFERNLRNLAALATANHVQVVFSSWAYFPDSMGAGIDPFMTYPYVQQAADEQNAILKQLAADTHTDFYDLAGNIPVNKDYWLDGMHLTATGTHTQAALYAKFLVDNHLIPDSAK